MHEMQNTTVCNVNLKSNTCRENLKRNTLKYSIQKCKKCAVNATNNRECNVYTYISSSAWRRWLVDRKITNLIFSMLASSYGRLLNLSQELQYAMTPPILYSTPPILWLTHPNCSRLRPDSAHTTVGSAHTHIESTRMEWQSLDWQLPESLIDMTPTLRYRRLDGICLSISLLVIVFSRW